MIQSLNLVTNATMGKSKELSTDLKKRIIELNKSGKSLAAISKQLQVPRATVQTIVCKYKVHGTVVSLPRSGRKRKLSPASERKLVRMVKSQPRTTKKQVCNALEAAGTQVSVSTVKRVLHRHGLRGCRARRKPLLQKRHLKARLKFAADQIRPSGGKFCGQMKQKLSCLATTPSNMFGGEKVRPLTPRTPCLPSSMVVVVLCSGPVLLPMELVLYRE